jgi:hypothetical protein
VAVAGDEAVAGRRGAEARMRTTAGGDVVWVADMWSPR